MTCKNLLVVVVLLSAVLGVDAKAAGRSPRKTEKLYRKAGKWQRKLRDVWALLGVKPFLVQPGEEGDECVLKSKVEEDYVLKGAAVFTQAQLDEAVAAAKSCGDEAFTIAGLRAEVDMMTEALAAKDDEIAAIGRGIVANYMSNDVVEANYVLKTDLDAAVAAATAVKDDEIAANYYHRDFVAAWYVLKTCGPFGSPQNPGYVCFSGPVCVTGPNAMSPGEQCCVTDCDRCA